MSLDKIKLVCTECAAINQFDQSKPATDARCGKCKAALAGGEPVAVSQQSLSRHIEHSGLPVLVDFWAPWCGPCQSFAPVFQQFASSYVDRFRCLKLDTEQHQQAGVQYGIRSIPTLALFRGGEEVSRTSGAMSGPQLLQWVSQQLA